MRQRSAEQWVKEGKGAIKWTRLSCRTILLCVSFANSCRRSPRIFVGATMTIWLKALAIAALLICSAIDAAKRSFCSSCQSVSSTELRISPTLPKARPGASLPCSCVGGSGFSTTERRRKLGNISSPSLIRNRAFWPSPTKTQASCKSLGLEELGADDHRPKAAAFSTRERWASVGSYSAGIYRSMSLK
jgi:hypothetical protein